MDKSGKQSIRCDVFECRHHSEDDSCDLKCVCVSSVPVCPCVKCADESMCASFEKRQG